MAVTNIARKDTTYRGDVTTKGRLTFATARSYLQVRPRGSGVILWIRVWEVGETPPTDPFTAPSLAANTANDGWVVLDESIPAVAGAGAASNEGIRSLGGRKIKHLDWYFEAAGDFTVISEL